MILSVIIPTLNESKRLPGCLEHVRSVLPEAEILVCDGGSTDSTERIARNDGAVFCRSFRGRGIQMNAGAALAGGDILLFLHADTRLAKDAGREIVRCFGSRDVHAAKFGLKFDDPHWLLKFYAYWTRFDSLWTSFGDQGLAVRKTFFHALGGFPDWPLFEDVRFLQTVRRITKIQVLPGPVVSSARRFRENGFLRQQIKNGRLIWKYLCGVSVHDLAAEYFEKDVPGAGRIPEESGSVEDQVLLGKAADPAL